MLPLALPALPPPESCIRRPVTIRRIGRAAAIVGTALLSLGVSAAPSFAADARVLNAGAGLYDTVQGQIGAGPLVTEGFAGILQISIDGGPQTDAYCVDLLHRITVNDILPQIPPDYPCEVVYILNNAFPTADNIAGALGDSNREAAAVQAAIWKFTDDFNTTAPADVASRAGQIIAAAQNRCETVPLVPQSIDLSPASATNYLDPLQGTGDTTHTVTATLYDTGGQPIPNYPIRIVVTGAAGPQTFDGTTDGSGQFVVTYANAFVVTGSDTITASVTFTVPVGLEFKATDKQGIVLAGSPRTGTVTGTATKDWIAAQCGDGLVNATGEECDDGNQTNGDGCDTNCTATRCGNNIQTDGEECDDGNQTNGDGCDANCTVTRCGNDIQTAGEECDDGNQTNGDGCDANCTATRCGNGIQTDGEECDDGNVANGDGCDANCTLPRCGNEVVDEGEQCDDGNQTNGDGCDTNCTFPGCGNEIVGADEECDDGNQTNGDGCDANCTATRCGNGIQTAGEECDDGNAVDGDGCEADCTLPVCGNAILDAGEQCDDGNTLAGDGCSALCQNEEKCADLVDNDGDNLIDCEDPDCATCPEILKDPASIKLSPIRPDRLRIHGGVIPETAVDPPTEPVGILITNANGVVYRVVLQPGDMRALGAGSFGFVDKKARSGKGSRNGLYRLKVRDVNGRYHLVVQAFTNLDAATLPTMATQFLIGNDVFLTKGVWTQTRKGWELEFNRFP